MEGGIRNNEEGTYGFKDDFAIGELQDWDLCGRRLLKEPGGFVGEVYILVFEWDLGLNQQSY